MPGILAGVLHSTSDDILGCKLVGTLKVLIISRKISLFLKYLKNIIGIVIFP